MSANAMDDTVAKEVGSSSEDRSRGLRSTTYHRVHRAILADIVNGTFAPGTRLKVAELCRRYDLSPMPIREALQQLQGEGFVIMSPNRGASVRPVDRNFVADIHEVRAALYPIVYRDVILSADKALDDDLVRIQDSFDRMVKIHDLTGCRSQNRMLHAAIEARCQNREISSLIIKYANLTSSLRDLFGYNVNRLKEISDEHWHIINAIRARDLDKATAAAQYHLKQALANMSEQLSR